MNQIYLQAIDIFLLIYGLVFIIWANKIFKHFKKNKSFKKNSNTVIKLKLWGLFWIIAGLIVFLFTLV